MYQLDQMLMVLCLTEKTAPMEINGYQYINPQNVKNNTKSTRFKITIHQRTKMSLSSQNLKAKNIVFITLT